jgi:hypothetical protein
VRLRIVLGLCLPLLLVACGGGLLPTPSYAPTPGTSPSPTGGPLVTAATPQATAGAQVPGEEPATPDVSGPEGAPEIRAGLVPDGERQRYAYLVDALRARDEVAADWLVETGLFLRDARLDEQELGLLDAILQGKGDPLWYLTHVRTMEGLDARDVEYLASITPIPSDEWYFTDDLRGLEAFELLSEPRRRSLQRIFERAQNDVQVRKGLYLINNVGLPDSRAFQYPVPGYNVQLYLLSRLLEQGVPGDYERTAVAAALTYGSLMTLCDQEAAERIVDYAGQRVRFLIDTDVLLAAAGAGWRATDYPLEALMVLLWGGQAAAYPEEGQPLAQVPALKLAATERPLSSGDLDRLLVQMDNLRQMQDEMMPAVIERTRDEVRACELLEDWWSIYRREEADDGGPDLNRQWARFREGRGFAGGAESAYVLQGLAASVNLPLPWAQLWYAENGELRTVPFGLQLDPESHTLRLGASAQRATADLPAESQAVLVWWRLPWDNWCLEDGVRSFQTLPLPMPVWRAGIPSGYLLRQSVLAADDALSALGLSTAEARPIPAASES